MANGRILLGITVISLGGCVAVAAGTYGKHKIAREDFGLAGVRNEFTATAPDNGYAEADVVALWGRPDERREHGTCAVLVYEDGTSWAGAGLFVGPVPVPALLPSGKYNNYIYLRDDRVVGAVREYGEISSAVGASCGSNECAILDGKIERTDAEAERQVGEWCGGPAMPMPESK